MTYIKHFMLACLLAMLGATAQGATYSGTFASGTDSWVSTNSANAAGFSSFANVAGGNTGNGLQVTDGGFGWGACRKVTGVVAGETFTYTLWYKMAATWTSAATDPKAFIRQETSAGVLVGAAVRSAQLVCDDTWRQITMTGTIAATVTQVEIGLGDTRGSGSASFVFDDVSFVSVVPGATVRVWDGGGADDNIITAANWNPDGAPVAADFLHFDGAVRTSPNLSANFSSGGVVFTNGASAFSITRPAAQVLTITGDLLNLSANGQTVGAQVTLSGAGRTIGTGANGISLTAGTVAASGFTKTGAGTLTLSGGTAPNLAGTVTVSGGTLQIAANEQVANTAIIDVQTANTTLTLDAGVTESIGRVSSGASLATAVPTGTINLGANAKLNMNSTFSGAAAASAVQINGAAGTVFTLTGNELRWTPDNLTNTFEKLVIGQGGILRIAHGGNAWNGKDSSLGTVPGSFLADQITLTNGMLGLNGGDLLNKIVLDANRGITVLGITANIETLVDAVIPGVITGAGALTHSGGRDLELQGVNDFAGGLKLGAGTVTVGNIASVGTGPITITANTGSLAVNTAGLTFTNGLSLASVVTNTFGGSTNYTMSGDVDMGSTGTAILRVSDAANTVTLSGALTNLLGFTKDGPGTLVLTGANTYSGNTTISNGTLHIVGSSPLSGGAVTIHGGKLTGTGTVQGTLTVDAGGTVNAGASPGTINTTNVVWNGGGTNVVEVNDATGTQGVNWDLINVSGTLTINATTGNKFTINPVSLTALNVPGAADNFNGTSDQDWIIVTTTGGIVGYDTSAFAVSTNNFIGIPDGGSFRVLLQGNNLVLHYSLVQPPLVTSNPVASQTVVSGTTVVLNTTAIGTSPLIYRWETNNVVVNNGGNISGADTASLTIANATPADSGSYIMTVTNTAGTDSSSASALTVIDPVAVTVQPLGGTIAEGANFNPTATVTGGGTITYRWKKNGVNLSNGGNITGANTASLLITAATIAQGGSYTLAITNEVSDTTSDPAVLVVHAPPIITVQPQSVSTTDGTTVNFSVTATGHDLTYQWSRNGSDLVGATDSSYSVVASSSTLGNYSVLVTNDLGTATSTSASLNLGLVSLLFDNFDSYADQAAYQAAWPVLTGTGGTLITTSSVSPPKSIYWDIAAVRNTRVIAESGVPSAANTIIFSFDFYDANAAAAPGRQIASLVDGAGGGNGQLISMGMDNNAGNTYYKARVLGINLGAGVGVAAELNGAGAPVRTTGWHNLRAEISLTDYKFYVDGILSKSVANTTTLCSYDLVRSGSALSSTISAGIDNVSVTKSAPVLNITQPESVSTNAGSTVVFSVTAPGATVYQWKKGGVAISGETTSALTLNSVLNADEGSYTVYVEDGFTATNSAAATLTVADPYISGQPVDAEVGAGTNVAFTVTASGTALAYQWYKDNLGGLLPGVTDATLAVVAPSTADNGAYFCRVTGADGFLDSDFANLLVFGPPTVNVTPLTINAHPQGANATFTADATGGGLSYQWYHGAVLLGGATDSGLTVSNVQSADIVGWTVVVSNLAGVVTSTPPAVIASLDADTTAPKLAVLTPGKNKGTNQISINVTGTVKETGGDNNGIVSSVTYSLNLGATNSAILTPTTPGSYNWTSSSPIILTPGLNTLNVWAKDQADNGSFVSVPFYYDTTNDLVLHIEGQGNVKMGTSVYSGATTLLTNTFKVGRSYKLDAFVGKGTNYIFTNWVTEPNDLGSSTNKWVQKSSLTFIMQSNMVITAKFNANPFTPVAGTYNGLFSETGGITHETAGFIQVKAKDKATYSGFLLFGGVKRPFSGKFLTDGTATGLVIRTKTTNQPPVNLAFALDLTPGETISGTVSATNGAWSSTITADKAVFSLSNPETNNLGSYTLQIPTSPGAPTSSPGGVGYSTVTNNPLGVAKFGGYLSDNQKITLSMNLTRDGHVPFYVGLYKTAAPKDFRGSLMGWLTFTNGEFGLGSDNVLTWIKQGNSEATAQYAAGFSNSVEVAGSKYVAPAPGIVPVKTGDYVIVSEGNLTDPVTNVVTAVAPTATGTKVTLSKTNTLGVENKATITFKAKDGTVTGGFNNPADKTKTQGIWLQNTTNVSGYFLKTGHTESGTFRVEQIIP